MTVAELIAILQQVPDQNMQVAVDEYDEPMRQYLGETRFTIYTTEWCDFNSYLHIGPCSVIEDNEHYPDVVYYRPTPTGYYYNDKGEQVGIYN
jgi:hypothetical protein